MNNHHIYRVIVAAERFIAGFEDDDTQNIGKLLYDLRDLVDTEKPEFFDLERIG